MNRRMVFYTVGKLCEILSILFILPAVTAIIYGEFDILKAFLISIFVSLTFGILLTSFMHPENRTIYAKEGFAIVALSWISVSVFGSLPFVISGDIPNFIDAFFETASGFTTTGASIVRNVEALSKGCLMWRSFTHWIGGMGVLVFIVALVPNLSERSIHILRAEMPGPVVGKLVPRLKDTAKILYYLYVALTLLEVVFLACGDMNLFESLVHSFGTAGTGGFGIKADSIGGYSPYSQWVITVFMLLFGINFNLYFLILIKRFKTAIKSSELWCYITICFFATATITANIFKICGKDIAASVRTAAFQVAAIVTTTGYSTVDFDAWPSYSRTLMLVLMFLGGCAGSTAGGLKISRVMILFKTIGREIRRLLHPRSVSSVRLEGKAIDENTVCGTGIYFSLYIFFILVIFLLLSLDPIGYNIETNFSASVSCFNNVGPALGSAGPAASYAGYSGFSKIILSFAMLFGRLEIFPLLLAFSPSTWSKRK